ncbi:MAG: hypothetical protein JW741_30615, partial [Sedimentisphaerales bacterium]|nr:hypothetical protein [Sedimentisphaerales bacterium]
MILYPLIQDGASLLMQFCPLFLHVGEFLLFHKVLTIDIYISAQPYFERVFCIPHFRTFLLCPLPEE